MKSQDFDIQEIIEQIVQFTKDREWDQFDATCSMESL